MSNNCICCNALQKFYSALKNLNNFSINNDIIDNISALDCFFAEFRNITFVLQKDFADCDLREKYNELCEKYLINDDMKWFINKRNEITKQAPIKLEKNITFEIYLPTGRVILENKDLKIDCEEDFNITKKLIKNIITQKLGMVDLFFSTKITFLENNEKQNLMPKIISGIETMLLFMTEVCSIRQESCSMCNNLLSKIENLYKETVLSEILFIHDYYLENNEIKSSHSNVQLYAIDNKLVKDFRKLRSSLNTSFWGNSNNISEMFEKFIILHIGIFNMSNRNIYPAFMLVYKDFTTQIFPIFATTKTAIYRNIYELVDNIDFKELLAIFYCGELYEYSFNDFNYINNLEYSERIKKAPKTSLYFAHINDLGKIKQYFFDVNNISCENYIANILYSENDFIDSTDNSEFFFLGPISNKFKEIHTKK